jgi:hypothetical protein
LRSAYNFCLPFDIQNFYKSEIFFNGLASIN